MYTIPRCPCNECPRKCIKNAIPAPMSFTDAGCLSIAFPEDAK